MRISFLSYIKNDGIRSSIFINSRKTVNPTLSQKTHFAKHPTHHLLSLQTDERNILTLYPVTTCDTFCCFFTQRRKGAKPLTSPNMFARPKTHPLTHPPARRGKLTRSSTRPAPSSFLFPFSSPC